MTLLDRQYVIKSTWKPITIAIVIAMTYLVFTNAKHLSDWVISFIEWLLVECLPVAR